MVNALNVTPERLLEQVNVWLATLSTMRLHGRPEIYRQSGDFVRRAYDLLRMLDLLNVPPEPPEPAGGWSIGRQIQALENVRRFLEPAAEAEEVADVEAVEGEIPAEYREGGRADGEPLTTPYLRESPDWMLKSAYVSKHYAADGSKTLTRRIKTGKSYAYLFNELAALRLKKTQNESRNE